MPHQSVPVRAGASQLCSHCLRCRCAADVEQAAVGGWWTIFVVASLTTFSAGRPDKIVLGTALFGWIQF